jgi:hypothetical protein
LDIKLIKESSLLIPAIRSPFDWQILKKTLLFSVLKIFTKNTQNKKIPSLVMKKKTLQKKPAKNLSLLSMATVWSIG